MMQTFGTFVLLFAALGICRAAELRLGMIGLDTSHVVAFTEILNDSTKPNYVPGGKVVAGFRGGSPDLESSHTRVDGYTKTLVEKYGVQIYPTIEELCRHVDAVLLESVDGRPHWEQARPVILAKKPLFIDKPMSASLRDVKTIFALAKEHGVPVFSASSLRFGSNTLAARRGQWGPILHAETTSPSPVDPTHPELMWYGIHGVESLFTVLGTGCESVRRTTSSAGLIEVRGIWSGGRSGIFREDKTYGGMATGATGKVSVGAYEGYAPLVREIILFFQTGKPPVSASETEEIFAFMEASDESKKRGGEPVSIREILAR